MATTFTLSAPQYWKVVVNVIEENTLKFVVYSDGSSEEGDSRKYYGRAWVYDGTSTSADLLWELHATDADFQGGSVYTKTLELPRTLHIVVGAVGLESNRRAATVHFTNPNIVPIAPNNIVVPALRAGKPVIITWDAATDSDGTIAAYELSRQMDGGAWTVVGTTANLSMTDTIGEDWTSVAYRVRAQDNDGAWSGYTTSAAVEVKPACGIPVTIDGIERELNALYCTIDGVVRPVEMAAGIDGVTREIF